MNDIGKQDGPLSRVRRRWSATRWMGRIFAVLFAVALPLLILLSALGAALVACGPDAGKPKSHTSPTSHLQSPASASSSAPTPTGTLSTPVEASTAVVTPRPPKEHRPSVRPTVVQTAPRTSTPAETVESPTPEVYYRNCAAARAAGAAPLHVGDPGYRAGLDRDGDGTACEK